MHSSALVVIESLVTAEIKDSRPLYWCFRWCACVQMAKSVLERMQHIVGTRCTGYGQRRTWACLADALWKEQGAVAVCCGFLLVFLPGQDPTFQPFSCELRCGHWVSALCCGHRMLPWCRATVLIHVSP